MQVFNRTIHSTRGYIVQTAVLAGILQKILGRGKVREGSTKSVMDSALAVFIFHLHTWFFKTTNHAVNAPFCSYSTEIIGLGEDS